MLVHRGIDFWRKYKFWGWWNNQWLRHQQGLGPITITSLSSYLLATVVSYWSPFVWFPRKWWEWEVQVVPFLRSNALFFYWVWFEILGLLQINYCCYFFIYISFCFVLLSVWLNRLYRKKYWVEFEIRCSCFNFFSPVILMFPHVYKGCIWCLATSPCLLQRRLC